jgi:hypothetical protein
MDEYINVNNFTWPVKKATVENDEDDEKSEDSFVIQIDEEDLIESEINQVCAEILIESQKRELWYDMLEENRRLGQTESDDEFDNFVEYCETVCVYQKTLEKLHDESQYAEFVRGNMP